MIITLPPWDILLRKYPGLVRVNSENENFDNFQPMLSIFQKHFMTTMFEVKTSTFG